MKVLSVVIHGLGRIRSLQMDLNPDQRLVCITGKNGTGKSQLLAAILRSAGALSIPGASATFPPYEFDHEVLFEFSEEEQEIRGRAEIEIHENPFLQNADISGWDCRIGVRITNKFTGDGYQATTTYCVSGVDEAHKHLVTSNVSEPNDAGVMKIALLDANRSYSRFIEYAGRDDLSRDGSLRNIQERVRIWGGYSGDTIFREWSQYLASLETEELQRLKQEYRTSGTATYRDPYRGFNEKLREVLPHISILGTDPTTSRLRFSTFGGETEFQELSGGEREIIFLLTVVDLMSVQSGVLLLDEPELHLHPELSRRFIETVQKRFSDVQIILSTHSFEVIDSALNTGSSFVLNDSTGTVTAEEMYPESAHALLVHTLGLPGLGLGGTTFVAVEGGGSVTRASTRFRELFGGDVNRVFLPAGTNKFQVTHTIATLVATATSRGEPLTIVGIVDSDYTSNLGARVNDNILSLGVHEVESLYLEPDALNATVSANYGNVSWNGAETEVRELSEKFAGDWVWNEAHSRNNSEWKRPVHQLELDKFKSDFRQLQWADIDKGSPRYQAAIQGMAVNYLAELQASESRYRSHLGSVNLWKHCDGKRVLKELAARVGIPGQPMTLEAAIARVWMSGQVPLHSEWRSVESFLNNI